MKAKTYGIFCAVITTTVVLAVLYVPGLSDAIEGLLIAFLSSNAS